MSEKDFYLYIDGKLIKVSREVYQEYYRGERKERYFMEDLKVEQIVIDMETQTVRIIPSREDSYERLLDENVQFAVSGESVEEKAVRSTLLAEALHTLSPEEQALIHELYFLDKTEREVGAALQLSQVAIHKRKNKILEHLRQLLK